MPFHYGMPEVGARVAARIRPETATTLDVLPGHPMVVARYRRRQSATWAIRHAHSHEAFPGLDCAWFAAECLLMGGVPLPVEHADQLGAVIDGRSTLTNWCPSKATVNGVLLTNYLINDRYAKASPLEWEDKTAGGAALGDLIAYDWTDSPPGIIDHLAVVTSVGEDGAIHVSQHSPPRLNRPWAWDPTNRTSIVDAQRIVLDGVEVLPAASLISITY